MNNDKQNKAINDLMENYNELVNQIFRFIYLKTSSKEIAEDLTQDCFLSTVKYLKDKEGFLIPNYNLIKCKMKLEEQKIK